MEEIRAVVAQNIKRLRANSGMTQEQVANAIGVDPVSFRHYEYGKRFPKPEILERLGAVLSVPESEFFVRPGQPTNTPPNLPGIFQTLAKHSDLIEMIAMASDDDLETVKGMLEVKINRSQASKKSSRQA